MPPVDDFRLVDLVALVVEGCQTGRQTDCTVDVDRAAALPANQVMVVVANPIFEAGRRPGWLNAADETFGREHTKRVVHRLERNRTDLVPDRFRDGIRGDVRLARDGPEHGEPLRRDLDAALTKELSRIGRHATSLDQIWNDSKI